MGCALHIITASVDSDQQQGSFVTLQLLVYVSWQGTGAFSGSGTVFEPALQQHNVPGILRHVAVQCALSQPAAVPPTGICGHAVGCS
jgi:hypothetical protein